MNNELFNPKFCKGTRKMTAAEITGVSKMAVTSPISTMYHVSRQSNRTSILKKGLIPQVREFESIERKAGIYFMQTLEQALHWAETMADYEVLKPVDIWRVVMPDDIDLQQDLTPDMDDIYDAWVTYDKIPPDYLQVIKTVAPGTSNTKRPSKVKQAHTAASVTPNLLPLLEQFRRDQENWYEWDDDPTAFKEQCYPVSLQLVKFLASHGVESKAWHGIYITDEGERQNHWWVMVGPTIVDVTSDQFYPGEEEDYRIIVSEIGDPHYRISKAGFKRWWESKTSAITPADRTLYHGTSTSKEFNALKPTGGDLFLWLGELSTSKDIYTTKHVRNGRPRVYEVRLKPDVKLADLTNSQDEFYSVYIEYLTRKNKAAPDEAYADWATSYSGIHAYQKDIVKLLRIYGYAGVIVNDTSFDPSILKARNHHSVALWNMDAIENQQEMSKTADVVYWQDRTPEDRLSRTKDWVKRSGLITDAQGRVPLYHATPLPTASIIEKEGLLKDSYLAVDPETALHQAGRDRGLKAGKLVCFKCWVPMDSFRPSVFCQLDRALTPQEMSMKVVDGKTASLVIPKVVYHGSLISKIPSIMAQGLVSQGAGVFTSTSKELALRWGAQRVKEDMMWETTPDTTMVLFTIKTDGLQFREGSESVILVSNGDIPVKNIISVEKYLLSDLPEFPLSRQYGEVWKEPAPAEKVASPVFDKSVTNGIALWHGGRLDGAIDIQAPTKGRYEAGPGLYLTTSYSRATKYSKGGGATFLVTLRPNLRLADDVLIPLADGIDFAKRYLGGKGKEIAVDLKNNCSRSNKDAFAASILINLVVNYEAGAGQKGVALLKFLVDHGVDAAIENQSGGEQWVVVFNPRVVVSTKKVPAADVTESMWNLPKYASAYKPTLTFDEMKAYVNNLHKNGWDGNEIKDWSWVAPADEFKLTTIPIDDPNIRWGEGKNSEKTKEYASSTMEFPPVVIGSDGYVIDGYHRHDAARMRGDNTIRAYVGVRSPKSIEAGLHTKADAETILAALNGQGLGDFKVAGSVSLKGQSNHDIDILVNPLRV